MNIQVFRKNPFTPTEEWPENSSIDVTERSFRIYLPDLSTFIHKNCEDAESAEWLAHREYQGYLKCKKHSYQYSIYTDGAGVCKHCGMYQSDVLVPTTKCCICNHPTAYRLDNKDNWYCRKCEHLIPSENLFPWQKDSNKKMNKEDIEKFLWQNCDVPFFVRFLPADQMEGSGFNVLWQVQDDFDFVILSVSRKHNCNTASQMKAFLLHEIGHIVSDAVLAKSKGECEFLATEWAYQYALERGWGDIVHNVIVVMEMFKDTTWNENKGRNRKYILASRMFEKKHKMILKEYDESHWR